jgi:hypothetical protein
VVGVRVGGLSGLSGCAVCVGVGTLTGGFRFRRCAASASGAVSGVSGYSCVVAGHGVAAARVRVELIGALVARAGGWGHRSIGRQLGVPPGTVRGWLRVMGARVGPIRTLLLGVVRRAGVDQPVPKAQGLE